MRVTCPDCKKSYWIDSSSPEFVNCECGRKLSVGQNGPATLDIPIVSEVAFSRQLLGGHVEAEFRCPHCRKPLKSQEEEVGIVDACPNCEGAFVLGDVAISVIEKLHKERAESERRKLMMAEAKQADSGPKKQL